MHSAENKQSGLAVLVDLNADWLMWAVAIWTVLGSIAWLASI